MTPAAGTTRRYAVYFVPPQGSSLAELGAMWLGRDIHTGLPRVQPDLTGLSSERLKALTESPRRYGFHATIKAPFEVQPYVRDPEVHAAVATLVKSLASFELDLELACLEGFLALVPRRPSAALEAMEAMCVTELDHLRAPLSELDRARRLQSGLGPREQAHLARWGYPHVLDLFRFHMTFTERLAEPELSLVRDALAPLVAPVCAAPVRIDALSVVEQPDRTQPFLVTGRFVFPT